MSTLLYPQKVAAFQWFPAGPDTAGSSQLLKRGGDALATRSRDGRAT